MTTATGNGWTMHLGDCLDVMATLAPVDHVITDPPYEAEAHTKQRRALKDATQKRGAMNKGEVRRVDACLDFAAITADERSRAAVAFAGLASRWTIAFCQIEAVGAWKAVYVDAGFDWVRGCVWRKPDGMPQFTGDRPGTGVECFAVAHPPGRKRWNAGGKHGFYVCGLEHGHGGGGKSEHPTKKPIALMLEILTDFTDRGETILDPFAGSGTTGVAALRLGRNFVGIEKDPKYFALAVERLRAEEQGSTLIAQRAGQLALLGGSK